MKMLPPKMTMDIASPPDRERLVAEIFHEGHQWAEIHQKLVALTVEIHPRRDGQPWAFPLHEAISALQIAAARLVGDAGEAVSS